MIEIIPSILVTSREEFERRLRLVENGCTTVHVDILDGSLFPQRSWYDAAEVAGMATEVEYELHLMVNEPLPIVKAWADTVPNVRRAIVHAEMSEPLGETLKGIRGRNLQAAVAINPETPLERVSVALRDASQLTVMGVHPGASGQAFLGDEILEKIRTAAQFLPDLPIEIDGGVTAELLEPLARAGITRVCAASLLFSSTDPAQALRMLRERVSTLAP
jgi:ribulose-phosphate 3-epimerase